MRHCYSLVVDPLVPVLMPHRLKTAVAVLPCADLQLMLRFYVDRLGFERQWVWPESPQAGERQTDAGVASGDVQVFFMTDAALAARSADRELMIFTDDVDAYHAECVTRRAPIVNPPVDEPWGLREFSVLDPHGNRLRFAESVDAVRIRSRIAESEVRARRSDSV